MCDPQLILESVKIRRAVATYMASHGTSFRFPAKSSMVLIHNLLDAYTKVWRNMYIPHWICGNTPPLPPRSSSVVLLGMCKDLRENLRWANVNGASKFSAPKPGQFSGFLQSVYYSSCTPDLLMWWTIMRCFYLIGVVWQASAGKMEPDRI